MRRTLLLAALITGLAATPAGAFTAADACDNLGSCQLQTGPWVVVPAAGVRYGEGNYLIQCPQLLLAAGMSYTASGGPVYSVTVDASATTPELPIYRFFVGFNGFSTAFSYQPGVGCTHYQFIGARARTSGLRGGLVLREASVRPSQTLRFTNRCIRGKRFRGDGAGVAFKTKRPPTGQEIREVRLTHTRTRTGGVIRVTVGPHVGDHESVVVQVQKRCV